MTRVTAKDFKIDNAIPQTPTKQTCGTGIDRTVEVVDIVDITEPRKPNRVIPHDIRGKVKYYLSEKYSYIDVCSKSGLGVYEDTKHGNREAAKVINRILTNG